MSEDDLRPLLLKIRALLDILNPTSGPASPSFPLGIGKTPLNPPDIALSDMNNCWLLIWDHEPSGIGFLLELGRNRQMEDGERNPFILRPLGFISSSLPETFYKKLTCTGKSPVFVPDARLDANWGIHGLGIA